MPSLLKNKRIIIGVTGGIAAYKAPFLVRLLKKQGAFVQVLMTSAAHQFVTANTLATVSENPVFTDFFKNELGEWNNHVEFGLNADAIVIAPAGANTLSKLATGQCDNLLLTTVLSAHCPVFFAPAMDLDMLKHKTVQKNLKTLLDIGYHCINPGYGELASGLIGEGRMAEPEEIVEALLAHFSKNLPFAGKKVLVTAGPTYENIDPVRFIGNHSSGKMGYAIAEAFSAQGAEVTLISGPTALAAPAGMQIIPVQSAQNMFEAVLNLSKNADIIVMAAAVADYKPAKTEKQKIKKKNAEFQLDLVKNPDILSELGKQKPKNQILVGFALETENQIENATAKLQKKNLDLIVLNSPNNENAGFGFDTNKITIIQKGKKAQDLPLDSKKNLAFKITESIAALNKEKKVHAKK